jgi:para-aminobenzoate synthetase component 1
MDKGIFNDFVEKMNKLGEAKTPFLFIIDYEMNKPIIIPLEETAKFGIFFAINGRSNHDWFCQDDLALKLNIKPIKYEVYLHAFKYVMKEILIGNTFLLNLTFPTEIETNWSLRRIYERSKAQYRLLFRDEFVLFSPEPFVRIKNGIISSFPMKGTIDASFPNAREAILMDEKELAEHATIVDLIRNDLSLVSQLVNVRNYRYVDKIVTHDKELFQVSSEISGILPDDYIWNLGTILAKLLPAGSICGAPKASTMKIIRDAEGQDRGYYTGVFGIFDGSELDSAVMIRFIEYSGGKLCYRSGGGITNKSQPEKEYQELIDKVYVAIH